MLFIRGSVARLGATFRAIRGIGEGRDETKLKRSHETKLKRSHETKSVGGNLQNKSSRRLHDERQKSRFVSRFVSSKSGLVKPFVGCMKRKKRTFIRKGIEYIDSREKSLDLRFTELWGID